MNKQPVHRSINANLKKRLLTDASFHLHLHPYLHFHLLLHLRLHQLTLPHAGAEDEPERVHARERLGFSHSGLPVFVQAAPVVGVVVADDVEDDAGDEVGQHGHEPDAVRERGEDALQPLLEAGLWGAGPPQHDHRPEVLEGHGEVDRLAALWGDGQRGGCHLHLLHNGNHDGDDGDDDGGDDDDNDDDNDDDDHHHHYRHHNN